MDDGTIFYKKEPELIVTTKGVRILIAVIILSVFIWLDIIYDYYFLHNLKGTHYFKISLLCLTVAIFFTLHVRKRIKSPHVAKIYDSGIWLQDHKIYIPYEIIYSTELVYPSHRKIIRSPFIYTFVSEAERKEYLKSFNLKILNFYNKEKNLLKLDLGTSEVLMVQNAEKTIDKIHSLAEEHNQKSGIAAPYYFVESKPSPLKRFLSLLRV